MRRRSTVARRSDRGQSETLGVVLLLGMAVVGTTVIVALGATALQDARDTSRTTRIEHAFTQLDSRIAMVALGNTDSQTIDLADPGTARYEVRPDAGWVNVTHRNHSGSGAVETIVNATLGAIVYDDGSREIAYQAGGVWRYADNGSVMVSPPEFHYRDSTLTFPLIEVEGNDSVSGDATVRIDSLLRSRPLFANASDSYDVGGDPYLNPVEDGNVTVTLRSQYYGAWAAYFRDRTEGTVTEFHNNDTVRLTLTTPRTLGDFDMPSEGNAIEIRGLAEGHPIDDFTITLKADNTGNDFNNMHWSLHEESGNEKLEIHIYSPEQCNPDYDGELDVSVFYYNGTGGYHEWQNQSVDPSTDPAFDVDCDDHTLTADLAGATSLTFDDISLTGGDNKWYYGPTIDDNSVSGTVLFDQHDVDDDGGRNGEYNASNGETEELGFLTNHYLSLLGSDTDLTVTDGPGGSSRIDEGASSGTIDYDTDTDSGGFLTFLHVTENRIEAEID